jgi:hypothetical protein
MEPIQLGIEAKIRDVPGIVDSDWLTLTGGITVLTGRNNVGKTRILRAIADIKTSVNLGRGTPAEIRVTQGQQSVEIGLDPQGLARRYEERSNGVTTTRLRLTAGNEWQLINERQVVVREGGGYQGFRHMRGQLPMSTEAYEAIQRIVYVPPQRIVASTGQTIYVGVPDPGGSNLAQAIFSHRNDATEQFAELERVMSGMFSEIGHILTPLTDSNQVTVTIRDRFSGEDVALNDTGTGIGQALNIVAAVLFSPPGRVFLIDEPHVYLHPGAERTIVRLLRDHPEHSYVCATHSPVFINAAEPERCWLVTRDESGTRMQSIFQEGLARQHILAELGIRPGDVALAERVIFVEGVSDLYIYSVFLRRLGFDPVMRNCAIIQIGGSGTSKPLAQTLKELSDVLHTQFMVCLDGDQRHEEADPHIQFLDIDEIEDLFLVEPKAVFEGITQILREDEASVLENPVQSWSAGSVQSFINERMDRLPRPKASKILTDLAFNMGTTYRKSVHGPAISEALSDAAIEGLRPIFSDFFEAQADGSPTIQG